MNFDLGPDEVALRDGIRELCRGKLPLARLREMGVGKPLWHALGEAGVFSMRIPERDGGVGLGTTQAAIVFEELGRALVPGPLVGSHLSAGLIDRASTGERIIGLIERGGTPVAIEHLDALDALVVLDDDGLWTIEPKKLKAVAVERPLDPLTPLHTVETLPRGSKVGGADVAARWRLEGTVLTAALCAGVAASATDLAVAYAKERTQFGRPIGSFQAVKHLCADMLVRAEVARAAVDAAAVILDDPASGDLRRAVAAAKLIAGEAAFANAKAAIQVHGGMGFTWEVDVHLFLKRACVYMTHFGSSDEHAETMAACL